MLPHTPPANASVLHPRNQTNSETSLKHGSPIPEPRSGVLYQAFPIPWKAILAVLENRAKPHQRFMVEFWLANLENDRQRLARLLDDLKADEKKLWSTGDTVLEEPIKVKLADNEKERRYA